jgi:hypothetical protein
MPKGTFMIYIFLEDYTVNENATLLKSKMCGQGELDGSLWISDGLRRPRSLSLSSFLRRSRPRGSAPVLRLATLLPTGAPRTGHFILSTSRPQLSLSLVSSSSSWAEPVRRPNPPLPSHHLQHRLLQLPHLLLDVPNPSFLQLQPALSSSCGRGGASQGVARDDRRGAARWRRGLDRARSATRGAPPMPGPDRLRACRCAPPRR